MGSLPCTVEDSDYPMADVDSQSIRGDLIAGVGPQLGFDGVEEIGRGGFGVVYRCVQPQLDRLVAVKVLTDELDPDNLDRFLREQRAMGRLSGHPHIVTILQVGTTPGGRPYLVMPYHARGSLWSLLSSGGLLNWRDALGVGVKLAGALEAAHHAGVLHRDVKPGNILLTDYGEPQLTDFGLARVSGGFETRSGVIIGSPAFLAPEILEGATPAVTSDVYSLGATLCCAVTGHPPYGRSVPDLLRENGLPDEVAAVIERMTARDPADRPSTAAGCGEQLRRLQRDRHLVVDGMALPVDASGRRDVAFAPPAPTTKYRPPVATGWWLPRERLMTILRGAGRRRLILLYAPSGYGKTTLAAQWRTELTNAGVAVGWLRIDDDDNNAAWFLAHVIEAIRRARPAVAGSLARVLEERGQAAMRYVLTSLVDEIDQNGYPITLVIDDWQRVSNRDTVAALRFLIDHGSHHLQIMVNSWSRAQLPLSKLRIQDELVEIDCAVLRFDIDEADSLLNDIGGLRVPGPEVTALTASTDGWVAALQLASLSLRGGGDAATLLSQLSGENEEVGEFLAENVLDALDPPLVEFLLATSITERICADLASALTGVGSERRALEDVERRGLFLSRIDGDTQWFRYHQLFAGFLRRRLESGSPDRLKTLHRAASAWFTDRGYLTEAVDHALAGQDTIRAIELVEDIRTRSLINQSRMTTFLGIVDKIPAHLVQLRPQVHLSVAWASILLQRRAATDAALDRFYAAMSNTNLPETQRDELTLSANVVRAIAQTYADRVDGLTDLVAEAMSRAAALRPVLPQAAATIEAYAAVFRFDFDAAHRLLEWAEPYTEQVGTVGTVFARCWAGIAARHQLNIPLALRHFRDALEIGSAAGSHSHAARLSGALLGELLYETGALAEAAELLEDAYHLGREGGGVDYLATRYVAAARTQAAQGNRESAAGRLDAGMAVAEEMRLPRLAAAINHERVRLRLSMDPSETDRLRAERTIPYGDDGIATVTAELDEASGIRLLSRSHASDDREQACWRSRALLAGIDPTARPMAALQARLLVVETLIAAGRADDARADIAAVRALCARHGLTQLLVDAGLG
ncbi:protein kinase [Mycobacterium shigaense]|nr:serine/threonine-protein kinase [Mycobacterium shigaense]MEA1123753.1 protein kinase [Mycobacterium shigaense]